MATWQVFKDRIEIFPHPNAEKLELGKIGTYQVVVQKGIYTTGDEVVFVPEKSLLSGRILTEYQTYLVGKDKNRVKAVFSGGRCRAVKNSSAPRWRKHPKRPVKI